MKPTTLTTENFDTTLNSTPKQPVLVDFWAEWCGPCKMPAPILDELATSQQGRTTIAKVHIDENPELAARFGITAIPTLILFKDGQAVNTIHGLRSKAFLEAALTA
jgi:thioredoxin 1